MRCGLAERNDRPAGFEVRIGVAVAGVVEFARFIGFDFDLCTATINDAEALDRFAHISASRTWFLCQVRMAV